jgi:hypothetical protein
MANARTGQPVVTKTGYSPDRRSGKSNTPNKATVGRDAARQNGSKTIAFGQGNYVTSQDRGANGGNY